MPLDPRAFPTIEVKATQDGGHELLFDGEIFPWYISDDGVQVSVDRRAPRVTVTILAERVKVDNQLGVRKGRPSS